MTRRDKKKLLRAFSVAYELAYRRGFCHGFYLRGERPNLTLLKILKWRGGPVKRRGTPPPEDGSGWTPTHLSRMTSESREYGEVIRNFLYDEPSVDEDDL